LNSISGIKNSDIGAKNGYFGNINQIFQDDIVVRPQCSKVYGNISQTSVAFVMARSIVSLNLIPFSQRISESNKLKRFIEQSDSLDGEILRDIVQTAEKLISD